MADGTMRPRPAGVGAGLAALALAALATGAAATEPCVPVFLFTMSTLVEQHDLALELFEPQAERPTADPRVHLVPVRVVVRGAPGDVIALLDAVLAQEVRLAWPEGLEAESSGDGEVRLGFELLSVRWSGEDPDGAGHDAAARARAGLVRDRREPAAASIRELERMLGATTAASATPAS